MKYKLALLENVEVSIALNWPVSVYHCCCNSSIWFAALIWLRLRWIWTFFLHFVYRFDEKRLLSYCSFLFVFCLFSSFLWRKGWWTFLEMVLSWVWDRSLRLPLAQLLELFGSSLEHLDTEKREETRRNEKRQNVTKFHERFQKHEEILENPKKNVALEILSIL